MTEIHDVCCCAGLASDGYHQAGLAPRGYDLHPQPDYPYRFELADVLEVLSDRTIAASGNPVHVSPPCQLFTRAKHLREAQGSRSKELHDLTPSMAILRTRWTDVPWVVENVDGPAVRAMMAPRPGEHLTTPCGSSFGLPIRRHRLFLSNFPIPALACDHASWPIGPKGRPKPIGIYHVLGDRIPSGGHTARTLDEGLSAMGVDRALPWDRLKEGIPPAYAKHVGQAMLAHLLTLEAVA